jgi:hypothetical protein
MLKAGSTGNKRKHAVLSTEEVEQQREENELEAEMNAVAAMRAEKAGKSQSATPGMYPYNKEGLTKALDSLPVNKLTFAESMHICEFEVTATNENDDLEREVSRHIHRMVVSVVTLLVDVDCVL